MASRKLKVNDVFVESFPNKDKNPEYAHDGYSVVTIRFSRKLSALEVSGVKAVLEGEIR